MLGWHPSVRRSMSHKEHLPHLSELLLHKLHGDVGDQLRLSSFNGGS